jgi:hypothetical protein
MMKSVKIDTDYLLWRCRQYVARSSWPAILGVALLMTNVVVATVWLRPIWKESRDIQAQSKALRLSATRQQTLSRQSDPTAQLVEFYKLFPGSDSLTDTLEKIYAAATENNIPLNQGDYSLVSGDSGTLEHYEISLPLHGKYVQVRNFIAKVLSENKNVALTSISFSRNSTIDSEIDAQARFTLFVKDAP